MDRSRLHGVVAWTLFGLVGTFNFAPASRGENAPPATPEPAPAQQSADDGKKVDPLVFVALDAAPTFREVIAAKDWDARFKMALDKLGGLAKIEQSKQTEFGELVTQVKPGSQAIHVGLLPGDVICEIDGQPLQRRFNEMRNGQPQTMTISRGEEARRTVPIEPDRVGFGSARVFRPELFFVHQGQRDPKWDELALVGAATCLTDPELSETAWHYAIAKGYQPDALSDVCGAQAAWHQKRIAMAEAFAHRAAAAYGRPPAALDVPNLNYALAIADFKIDQAIAGGVLDPNPKPPADDELVGRPSEEEEEKSKERHAYLGNLLNGYRSRPEAQRLIAIAAEGAPADRKAEDLMKCLEVNPDRNNPHANYCRSVLADFAKRDVIDWNCESDHYMEIVARSTIDTPDVRWTLHTTTTLADDKVADFDKNVYFKLVDSNDPNVFEVNGPAVENLLTAYVSPDGTVRVEQSVGNQSVTLTSVNVGASNIQRKGYTLRMIHAHGRDEVWLDKQRLLFMPAEQHPARVGVGIVAVGTNNNVRMEFERE